MKFTTTTLVLACSVSAVVAGKGKKDKYDDYDDYGKKEGRSEDIHPTAKPTSQPVRRRPQESLLPLRSRVGTSEPCCLYC